MNVEFPEDCTISSISLEPGQFLKITFYRNRELSAATCVIEECELSFDLVEHMQLSISAAPYLDVVSVTTLEKSPFLDRFRASVARGAVSHHCDSTIHYVIQTSDGTIDVLAGSTRMDVISTEVGRYYPPKEK